MHSGVLETYRFAVQSTRQYLSKSYLHRRWKGKMTGNQIKNILGSVYVFKSQYEDFLKSNKIEGKKFVSDSKYALIKFFDVWGLERNGSTKEQKLAAIKFLQKNFNELENLSEKELESRYTEFKPSKINSKSNPVIHKSIATFDIKSILDLVNENKIEEAYNKLICLNGIGHKIASFFLRDASYFFAKQSTVELYYYAYFFPVDIWIRGFIDALDIENLDNTEILYPKNIDKNDFARINKFCIKCNQFGFDIRTMNFCIWHFCAKYVGNKERLKKLVESGAGAIKEEINLMNNALEID